MEHLSVCNGVLVFVEKKKKVCAAAAGVKHIHWSDLIFDVCYKMRLFFNIY